MRVYLDNCCYNRPYDNQSQLRISLETQAKLYIQQLIRNDQLEMASSYVLHYENGQNPYRTRKTAIAEFMHNCKEFINIDQARLIQERAESIINTGVKTKDAYHVACAIEAKCDFLLTTDDRLLKYHTDEIELLNPLDFIKRLEAIEND
jgi:predicted nucleic acid-binding protein